MPRGIVSSRPRYAPSPKRDRRIAKRRNAGHDATCERPRGSAEGASKNRGRVTDVFPARRAKNAAKPGKNGRYRRCNRVDQKRARSSNSESYDRSVLPPRYAVSIARGLRKAQGGLTAAGRYFSIICLNREALGAAKFGKLRVIPPRLADCRWSPACVTIAPAGVCHRRRSFEK